MSRLRTRVYRNRHARGRFFTAASNTADIGGWTAFPTPVTAVNIAGAYNTMPQVGTRIYYIDQTNGHDGTPGVVGAGTAWSHLGTDTTIPDFYLWDGTNLLDSFGRTAPAEGASSGVPYGTSVENPTGPIKPFKSYGFCGPRSNSTEIGTITGGLLSNGRILSASFINRAGKPDFWLFKRGQDHDLEVDLLAWQAVVSGGSPTTSTYSLTLNQCSTGTQMIGAWGNPASSRPRFTKPVNNFFYRNIVGTEPNLSGCRLQSLHFAGSTRTLASSLGVFIQGGINATDWTLIEDCFLDTCFQNTITSSCWVKLRRCVILRSWAATNSGIGLFSTSATGDVGNQRLLLDGCILVRNGFDDDPTSWPPASGFASLERNLYISCDSNVAESGLIDSVVMMGGSGDQIRGLGRCERNFLYMGYFQSGGHGRSYGATASGTYEDNVLQVFNGSASVIPNAAGAHPPWGYVATWGAANMSITRNIQTRLAADRSTNPSMGAWVFQAQGGNATDPTDGLLAGNRLTGNITDCGTAATRGVEIKDGGTFAAQEPPLTGIGVNTVDSNVFVKAAGTLLSKTQYSGLYGATPNTTVRRNSAGVIQGQTSALTGVAVVGTALSQVWKLTCTSIAGPTTFSVVGSNKAGGAVGALPTATLGVAYSCAYWSCSNIVDGGSAFAVGDTITFLINAATFPDVAVIDANNREYTTVALAATAMGYPDTERTLATYLVAIGGSAATDGVDEYVTLAAAMRKGQWRTDLTAKYINNYIRAGYAVPPLP